ncbi:acyl-CoA thioesterase [Neisseria montereyensis]|uniref:Acyl-CoA thioesterase n=1 Tax=Neisseria montereyensis TaxID=2973938 RepID=A0ABT2FAR7_9NEIS|nr:acyl-CoA thioesterase [Neisseria montereyensis]MCS4533314.1 acyl-CoA thioesterase [Neisseria montereyensis]
MARIQVPLPAAVLFRTQIRVRVGDINYGNHLANDAVLGLCHESRMRWLAVHGFTELDAGGSGLIMGDAAVQYLAQAHYGDTLEIEMGCGDIGRSGFELRYHIRRQSDGKSIAKIQTGMVCFDYTAQKITRLPARLADILNQAEPLSDGPLL